MTSHKSLCLKLIQALDELMPNFFVFQEHDCGPNEQCFRIIIKTLVEHALAQPNMMIEYSIACTQIAEIFEPVPLLPGTPNHFKYLLTNQCHLILQHSL